MKHFKRIRDGIDVAPFLNEIEAHPELWDLDPSRQENKPAQRETKAICIRAQGGKAILDSAARQYKPIGYWGLPTSLSSFFPIAEAFIEQLAGSMKGAMGRAVITRLSPGGRIHPHIDDRLYWLLRDRYHLVIKSPAGSFFRAGGEEVRMGQGELWWFDHSVEHEVFNDTDVERIHLIVDLLSPHSIGTFFTRLWRAPARSLHAVGGAAVRALRGPPEGEETLSGN